MIYYIFYIRNKILNNIIEFNYTVWNTYGYELN
jgi:hypothetical protein